MKSARFSPAELEARAERLREKPLRCPPEKRRKRPSNDQVRRTMNIVRVCHMLGMGNEATGKACGGISPATISRYVMLVRNEHVEALRTIAIKLELEDVADLLRRTERGEFTATARRSRNQSGEFTSNGEQHMGAE